MRPSEKLIPLLLYKDMLDESMSSNAEGTLSLSISSEGSSRHGPKEELDTDDPFRSLSTNQSEIHLERVNRCTS